MTDRIAVLVVDDEVLVRLDVAEQRRDGACEALEASNADEATEILNVTTSMRPLFTDIVMPGTMESLKLAGAVRDRWPPVKIIVESGQPTVDVWQHVFQQAMLPSGCPQVCA